MKILDYDGLSHAIGKIKNLIATKFDKSGGTISGDVTISGNLTGRYLTGTWLKGTADNHHSTKQNKVCVMDGSGWVYHRTLEEFKGDLGISVGTITEYRYTYTTPERQTVSFTIPTYTIGCTLDIYINGMYCIPDVDYTLSGNVVSITKELDGGQVCHFIVRKVE